jgi:hypothetical protein
MLMVVVGGGGCRSVLSLATGIMNLFKRKLVNVGNGRERGRLTFLFSSLTIEFF